MALTTYQELITAVTKWLDRENSSVTDRISDFILIGENAIFRRLRCRYNEILLTYDSASIDNTLPVSVPDRYKEVKSFRYNGEKLTRKSDEWYLDQDQDRGPGTPHSYCRIGDLFYLYPQPDVNADVILNYYGQEQPIGDSSTPTLFRTYPELYLFAALIEGFPYCHNVSAETLAKWEMKYARIIDEIEEETFNEEISGSTNTVDSPYPDNEYYGT